MSSYAVVFPGQGCQFVGMASDLCQMLPGARERFEQADEILGFSLSCLCHEGPTEILNDTANTQPAIYLATMVLWEAVREGLNGQHDQIISMAGHSLGEFAALTAAGAISFEQGLRLVRRRGEAMREAGECAPGGMAAIIGLSDETVHEIIAEVQAQDLKVWVANYNSPGQVVIAGSDAGLEKAMTLAQARKAKRAIPLAVSVACHTPLMHSAAEALREALDETEIRRPWVPVVSNTTAQPLTEPEAIRSALLAQLSSPVRWVESVRQMAQSGAKTMIEVGPKAVVSGLIRRIDREINLISVNDVASLEILLATLEPVTA